MSLRQLACTLRRNVTPSVFLQDDLSDVQTRKYVTGSVASV